MNQANNELLLPSRKEAVAAGHLFYAGKPCVHGHSSGKRYVHNWSCVACEQMRAAGLTPVGGWLQPRGPVTLDFLRANSTEDLKTGCWLWQRSTDRYGYGKVKHGDRQHTVHRVAFELSGGVIPPGYCVLHSCDRPLCCNPRHLSAGTDLDNVRDRNSKGRTARGENAGNSKFTEQQVPEVDALLAAGVLQTDIAAKFGVSRWAIYCIAARRTWKHVPNTATAPKAAA